MAYWQVSLCENATKSTKPAFAYQVVEKWSILFPVPILFANLAFFIHLLTLFLGHFLRESNISRGIRLFLEMESMPPPQMKIRSFRFVCVDAPQRYKMEPQKSPNGSHKSQLHFGPLHLVPLYLIPLYPVLLYLSISYRLKFNEQQLKS